MIQLRATKASDLDFVLSAESAGDNKQFIGQWSLEQHYAALFDVDYRHCIAEHADDHRMVGYLILHRTSNVDDVVQIRRIVVTEKGRGFGRQVLRQAKKLSFETLQAHRLFLDVVTYNDRAKNLYQSEGFVVEGIMRDAMRIGDRYVSLILMSILRHEYNAMCADLAQNCTRE